MRLPLQNRKFMFSEAVVEGRVEVQSETQRAAFLRLIDQNAQALRRLAGAYVERDADREDLFQEIAMALWQAIPKFRGESSERTWLYRIAHNVAISSSAKIRRKGRNENQILNSFDRPSLSLGAEHDLLTEERRSLLIGAVRDLPMADRQLLLLHLEDLSHAEIAEVTGLSVNAIATRLTRMREKLRERFRSKEVAAHEWPKRTK